MWIHEDGITLKGLDGASLTLPDEPTPNPCRFPVAVCVIPAAAEDAFPDFPKPYQFLRDIGVRDLTLHVPNGDGVGVLFTRGVDVSDNNVPFAGCTGVFVFFSSGISVRGNEVGGSADCDGIAVIASERARVLGNTVNDSAFSGILLDDVTNARVQSNSTSGNCIGIVAFDSDGFLPSADLAITRNVANANNTVCYPFGDDGPPVGATGILVAAVDGVVVKNNTANDNVTPEFTVTAGGISIQDFGDRTTENLLLSRNTAFGNSSAAGPADLAVATVGKIKAIKKNNCDVGVPVAAWCTG